MNSIKVSFRPKIKYFLVPFYTYHFYCGYEKQKLKYPQSLYSYRILAGFANGFASIFPFLPFTLLKDFSRCEIYLRGLDKSLYPEAYAEIYD
jgi:hypothetical protein